MSSSLFPILSQINPVNQRFIIHVYRSNFHLVIVRSGRKSRTVETDGGGGKKSMLFLHFATLAVQSFFRILQKSTAAYRPIAKSWLCKQRLLLSNVRNIFFFTGCTAPLGPDLWFFSFIIILQTVRLLGWVISSSQGLYLNTGQHEQNKHIDIPNTHALCGITTHDPGFRESEDSICLRPLGYRDRQRPEHICMQ
jgi:hypothetical protein